MLCVIIVVMGSLMSNLRSYSELITIDNYNDRFKYLEIGGDVGVATFGFDRYLNQRFYKTSEWRKLRSEIIVRDNGCDLGVDGYEIGGLIIVHHINTVSVDDIKHKRFTLLLNPEYLISTSLNTHNAIHYGDETLLTSLPLERRPNDTKLW